MAKEFVDILDAETFGNFFKENNLKKPTDVQAKAIPEFVEGKNISVLAKTGSGKTFSYLLPLIQGLKFSEESKPAKRGKPRAIILVPIKELATQVFSESKKITHHAKLRVRQALGGDKAKSLKGEFVDILIGGPGRIKSMLNRGEITLDDLDYFIIDEADQLMDMGFMTDLKAIRKHFKGQTQACLFSATMGPDFNNLKNEFFSGYQFSDVIVQGAHELVSHIETFNIALHYTEKDKMLELFLKQEAKGSGVIFINQKSKAQEVFNLLKAAFPKQKVYVLHGDMSAAERKEAFASFRSTKGILVSTDMAARGIDIKGLAWVLNYDLPFEAVYYVHRSGRVGRNGSFGKVFNFVTGKDQTLIKKINDAIRSQSSLKIDAIALKKNSFGGGNKPAAKKKVERRDTRPKRTPRYKR
jgi:superfamily II DNA/RNA helicase